MVRGTEPATAPSRGSPESAVLERGRRTRTRVWVPSARATTTVTDEDAPREAASDVVIVTPLSLRGRGVRQNAYAGIRRQPRDSRRATSSRTSRPVLGYSVSNYGWRARPGCRAIAAGLRRGGPQCSERITHATSGYGLRARFLPLVAFAPRASGAESEDRSGHIESFVKRPSRATSRAPNGPDDAT